MKRYRSLVDLRPVEQDGGDTRVRKACAIREDGAARRALSLS
jgi:hypothetical protein